MAASGASDVANERARSPSDVDSHAFGVGAPPDAVAGPSLSAVASDPEPLPGWALGAMLALIGLGAAFQAMRRPTRERAA